MPKYVFAYHGGPESMTPEEGQQHMQNWMAWRDDLGDAVVDPGVPTKGSRTVSQSGVSEDGGANPICGITVVEAADADEAASMAAKCPHIAVGGTIEVAEAMDMPM